MELPSGRVLDTGERPLVMGVLNVTPDSFSDGGQFLAPESALAQARRMCAEGADIIDIGGESTRPGSEPVSADEEMRRVLPVVEALAASSDVPISIDTQKAAVAAAALEAGAQIINDTSALRTDPDMAAVAARADAALVLMHMQGTPRTMQADPAYGEVVADVKAWLAERLERATAAGIPPDRLIVDPGFGFGKTLLHNLELLRRLGELHGLGRPLLVGTSRKSMLGAILKARAGERLSATLATVACAVMAGCHIVRVHDVRPALEVVKVCEAVRRGARYEHG
ncbi:MAG: dihydropteroate synthase [Candidatus Brocadiaceae bacterium]|nr:dihydropteroate synthase [Candidatus Brocadiaceae bacterium]